MLAVMKATAEAGSLEVRDVPMPRPAAGEVLVRMGAAGICYSDVMILKNKYQGRVPVPVPMIMGHEGAGVIAGIGEGVMNLKEGDRVALMPAWGCGHCHHCVDSHPNMCQEWRHLGISRDGTFAEYRVVPSFVACRLPPSVSMLDAAVLEPITLAVRTLEHVKPRLGDTVAIIGPGSIGLFHLQAFKSAGASIVIVIGLEQDAARLDIAKRLGADHVVNGSREDVVKRVRELTDGLGCDIVVEAANHPSTAGQAIDLASAYGRVMLFGLYPEATISPLTLMRSGLTVMGDVATTPSWFQRAIRWVQYRKVLAEPLITRTFGLDRAKEAFEAFYEGQSVKVLFEM
ncbi:MAG TPA: alcohol dehydrogenase catalytic domain-containing protein [Candidatus Methylomirabilis sp.]|nr:alcohol dehydrogenase catalytic domain-containing protein [Candidatus Methylomirabilis sp.]